MKKYFINSARTIAIISATITCIQCSDIPDGYIPDKILYVQDPFTIQKGIAVSTAPPSVNGASYPLFFTLMESIGPDGNPTTILTDSIETRVWKAAYDYNTDKSMDDIYAKLDIIKAPVMQISEASGQISFTASSKDIPDGEYKVTVRMANSAGVRIYQNVFTAHFKSDGDTYWTLDNGGGNYSWKSQYLDGNNNGGNGVWNFDGSIAAKCDIKHDPTGPNEIEFIVCDQNGKTFDWSAGEIMTRGENDNLERMCFEKPAYKSDRAVFKYPFAPFPFGKGASGGGYDWYYRVPGKFITWDTDRTPGRDGYLDVLIGFRALVDGKWTVTLTNPNVIHN